MVIELNTNPVQTAQAAHTPSFQSSFRPTASTISAQAAKPGESKSILGQIIDFIKKIFCCCGSSKGNDIAKLIEQGKAKEAAAAWVAVIEQDAEIAQDPKAAFERWVAEFTNAGVTGADAFAKKYFDIDDKTWGGTHLNSIIEFIDALPDAVSRSSKPSLSNDSDGLRKMVARIALNY